MRPEPCGDSSLSSSSGVTADDATDSDIVLTATVTAKSLRFEKVGKGTVTLAPQGPTSVCLLEHNLPSPIEPNRTYTDVVLKLMIRTSLAALTPQPGVQP